MTGGKMTDEKDEKGNAGGAESVEGYDPDTTMIIDDSSLYRSLSDAKREKGKK